MTSFPSAHIILDDCRGQGVVALSCSYSLFKGLGECTFDDKLSRFIILIKFIIFEMYVCCVGELVMIWKIDSPPS